MGSGIATSLGARREPSAGPSPFRRRLAALFPGLPGPSRASAQVLSLPLGPSPCPLLPSQPCAAPHPAACCPGAASSAGPQPVPPAAASCAPCRHRLRPRRSFFAATAFASVSSTGRSSSRRRRPPLPPPGPAGRRVRTTRRGGGGGSRRGLGAAGARHVALRWEGAPRSARASNFPR